MDERSQLVIRSQFVQPLVTAKFSDQNILTSMMIYKQTEENNYQQWKRAKSVIT